MKTLREISNASEGFLFSSIKLALEQFDRNTGDNYFFVNFKAAFLSPE